ncbi:F-Box Only Protein 9 [Manis pentadactyla]|nr:F-Box Only Protein 9 [Manis pentadactyla]
MFGMLLKTHVGHVAEHVISQLEHRFGSAFWISHTLHIVLQEDIKTSITDTKVGETELSGNASTYDTDWF